MEPNIVPKHNWWKWNRRTRHFLFITMRTNSFFCPCDSISGAFYSYSWTAYKWINVNLSVAFHTTALAHTTFLSIFRYVAINKPHFTQAHLNVTSCKRCIMAINFITPLLCIPTFFITSVDKASEARCGLNTAYELHYSASQNLWSATLWIFGVVFKLMPSSAIAVLSLNLIHSLKKFDVQRERLKNKNRKGSLTRKTHQQRLSKMLLLVAVLCVSVEIPHGLLQVLTAAFGAEFGVDVYDNLGDFFEMLTLLYNSINFVLYCLMSSEFQRTFRQLLYNPVRNAILCRTTLTRDNNSIQLSTFMLKRRSTKPRSL